MCKSAINVPGDVVAVPEDVPGTPVTVGRKVLDKNAQLGEANRRWLAGRGVLALNLLSSPGAGKTTLLERTIADLRRELALSVLEGYQETDCDACRIHHPQAFLSHCKHQPAHLGVGHSSLKPVPSDRGRRIVEVGHELSPLHRHHVGRGHRFEPCPFELDAQIASHIIETDRIAANCQRAALGKRDHRRLKLDGA